MQWGIIVCVLFSLAYNGYILWRFRRIPTSLSETAYLLGGDIKKYWFTLYCIIIGITLLPNVFDITLEGYEFIPFIFFLGLLFAGISPSFKYGLDKIVHYISASISFIGFVLYTILCIDWIWLIGYSILLIGLCIWKRKCYIYFAEILALITIIIYLYKNII